MIISHDMETLYNYILNLLIKKLNKLLYLNKRRLDYLILIDQITKDFGNFIYFKHPMFVE